MSLVISKVKCKTRRSYRQVSFGNSSFTSTADGAIIYSLTHVEPFDAVVDPGILPKFIESRCLKSAAKFQQVLCDTRCEAHVGVK